MGAVCYPKHVRDQQRGAGCNTVRLSAQTLSLCTRSLELSPRIVTQQLTGSADQARSDGIVRPCGNACSFPLRVGVRLRRAIFGEVSVISLPIPNLVLLVVLGVLPRVRLGRFQDSDILGLLCLGNLAFAQCERGDAGAGSYGLAYLQL